MTVADLSRGLVLLCVEYDLVEAIPVLILLLPELISLPGTELLSALLIRKEEKKRQKKGREEDGGR